MKRLFVVIICICSIYSASCQNIGLRTNTEISENKKINTAIGGGLYLNINDFSEKVEVLFSTDYFIKEKELKEDDLISYYNSLIFGVNGFYVLSIRKNLKTKIGPLLSYNLTNATDRGIVSRWINTYKAKYIGIGITGNIQFKKIFKLPINFDIFVYPTYLINIKNENDPTGVKSYYADNLKIFNVQLGLSYIIK